MSDRDYQKEAQWARERYVRINAKFPKDEYSTVINEIKKTIGLTLFIKNAIELYTNDSQIKQKLTSE